MVVMRIEGAGTEVRRSHPRPPSSVRFSPSSTTITPLPFFFLVQHHFKRLTVFEAGGSYGDGCNGGEVSMAGGEHGSEQGRTAGE
jgi:hypothetical protein